MTREARPRRGKSGHDLKSRGMRVSQCCPRGEKGWTMVQMNAAGVGQETRRPVHSCMQHPQAKSAVCQTLVGVRQSRAGETED
jgi:hypothetical protein